MGCYNLFTYYSFLYRLSIYIYYDDENGDDDDDDDDDNNNNNNNNPFFTCSVPILFT